MYSQVLLTVAPYQESFVPSITFIVLSAIGMAAVLVITAVLLQHRRHLGVSLTAAVVLLIIGVIGIGSGSSWLERVENSNHSFVAHTITLELG